MFDFGSVIQAGSNDFMNVRDQFHSAWFMNEQQKEAGHQFDLQMQASNSAMQRRVEDLKAAGLNPMLGYTSQASSPAGAGAAVGHAIPSHPAPQVSLLLDAQRKNVEADTELKLSSAAQAVSQTGVLNRTIDKIGAEISKIYAEVGKLTADQVLTSVESAIRELDLEQLRVVQPALRLLIESDAKRAELGLPAAENMSEVEKTAWGKIAAFVRSLGQTTSSGVGAAAAVKSLAK